jgi:hypothetical protein
MVNKPKIKGTRAESAVVTYLKENGFPSAERRALSGTQDKGDVAGVIGTVIEVKDCARDGLPGWMDETTVEGVNAGADVAVCWHKRRGRSSPADWFVTMTGAQFLEVLHILQTRRLPERTNINLPTYIEWRRRNGLDGAA